MTPYLPVLKLILPYIGPLAAAAAPMLTRTSIESGKDQPSNTQLITELQEAVKNNADSLKLIATQLQKSIEAFDERESLAQKKLIEIQSLIEANANERNSLNASVDAAIRDIQVAKLISLVALVAALISIVTSIIK